MLVLREVVTAAAGPDSGSLTLPFERRSMSRQRAELDSGEEVALLLPRGAVLRGGTVLRGDDGRTVVVHAAPEELSVAKSTNLLLLARVAYHLGNRHVPVQIAEGRLAYLRDHVLDDMVQGFGITVTTETAPFEPESGAYGEGAHGPDSAHPSSRGPDY
ncbi:MAG TPA: urease accessory protein UreE [Polyangiaceae bacterium]|nr:urease accessory protein UreE [Polyangiaceae bacterium]